MPVKKQSVLTLRKSSRLASKRPVVMDDDTTSHNTLEPTTNAPPSPKPATPPSHQIPSPPPSPIPYTPPPFNTHTSPGLGFANSSSVPTAPLDSVLSKLNDFSLSLLLSKMKFVSHLHLLLISLPRWRPVLVPSLTQ